MREQLFNLQKHQNDKGFLCVFQRGINVDFDIQRFFTVSASKGDVRGQHAHKQCSQLLMCAAGSIRVTCDDGTSRSEYLLSGMDIALSVPPRIWAIQEYLSDNSVLIVICDRKYEPEDYIRDYTQYTNFLQLG